MNAEAHKKHTNNPSTRFVIGGILCGLLLVAGAAYIYSPIQATAASVVCEWHYVQSALADEVGVTIESVPGGGLKNKGPLLFGRWYEHRERSGIQYNSRMDIHEMHVSANPSTSKKFTRGYIGNKTYEPTLYAYIFKNTLFDRMENLNDKLLRNTAGTYSDASTEWDELEREYNTEKNGGFMFNSRNNFTEWRTAFEEVLEEMTEEGNKWHGYSCDIQQAWDRYRVVFSEVFIFHEYNKAELVALFEEQKVIYQSLIYMNYGREPAATPAPTPAPETSGNEDDGTPTPTQPIVNEGGEDEEDTQSQIEEQPQTGVPAPPTSPALSGTHIADEPANQ